MRGDEVIITNAGTPLVRLVPLEAPIIARVAGLSENAAQMSDDFNAPLPDDFWLGTQL